MSAMAQARQEKQMKLIKYVNCDEYLLRIHWSGVGGRRNDKLNSFVRLPHLIISGASNLSWCTLQ